MNKFKTYLVAGLLIWVPIGLTIWIINFVIHTLDEIFPTWLPTEKLLGFNIPGSGLVLSLLILLVTGVIAHNFFGQKLLNLWDKLISSIPIVKSIYKSIKQVSDTLLASNGNAFRHAVLVKFPHGESYTIAFITGNPSANIITNNADYISVYVPTTPNPTSGYFLIVAKKDVQELDISVDQALRYIISMGTINPQTATPANLARSKNAAH